MRLARSLLLLLLLLLLQLGTNACAPIRARSTSGDALEVAPVRVMTFNLWHGGDAGGLGASACAEAIRSAGADLVGLQETVGRATGGAAPDRSIAIAAELGFEHRTIPGRKAILSRWPIVAASRQGHGVLVATPHGDVALFVAHLAHAPYQPYQLAGIEYHGGAFLHTAEEAVAAARAARGHEVAAILADIEESGFDAPVVLVGDFNEPSFLDWTERAQRAGHTAHVVAWPSTLHCAEAGFVDAYRAARPDEVAHPGHTWTPLTARDDPNDRHDRIDLVLLRAAPRGVARVLDCQVVGESAEYADVVVEPWPSDHRGVVATLLFERQP